MAKIIVINPGSASKKFSLYDKDLVLKAHYEKTRNSHKLTLSERIEESTKVSQKNYKKATKHFSEILTNHGLDKDIDAIAVRVVAPGKFFQENKLIDKNFTNKLKKNSRLAPLHARKSLSEIKTLKKVFPNTKIIAISDSQFHSTLPKVEKTYAIPHKDSKKFEIQKYGYHGISCASIVRQLKILNSKLPKRAIICHLGSGTSITAIKNGKSIATSMGFTPLEGVPMGTRTGNLDPSLPAFIKKAKKLTPKALNDYLNKTSGLLGLSGESNDIRALLKSKKEQSDFALKKYAYEIQKYIGAYASILGGIDWIVFTGTAGTRSAPLRKIICKKLDYFGVELDPEQNRLTIERLGFIQKGHAQIKIVVIPNNEDEQMYLEAEKHLKH